MKGLLTWIQSFSAHPVKHPNLAWPCPIARQSMVVRGWSLEHCAPSLETENCPFSSLHHASRLRWSQAAFRNPPEGSDRSRPENHWLREFRLWLDRLAWIQLGPFNCSRPSSLNHSSQSCKAKAVLPSLRHNEVHTARCLAWCVFNTQNFITFCLQLARSTAECKV